MQNKKTKFMITLICIVIAAIMQAYTIKVFIEPSNLLSSGFTGVALLINKITNLFGFDFSVSIGMILLNLPVAMLCYKSISPRFTYFSMLQVFLTSFFLQVFNFSPLFDDILLNIAFGGFAYGILTVIALKGNASTGGTDFIALYVSNKKGKSIWGYVFIFNTMILIIFGAMFGWEHAGYSILFQFISTKTIDSFYDRYERVTLQITTIHANEVIDAYVKTFQHGISCVEAKGGYSKMDMYLLHTVISSYEIQDAVNVIRQQDENAIINVLKTESFVGRFYQAPID